MSLHRFLTRLIWLCVGPLILLAIFLAVFNVMSKRAEHDIQAANLVNNFTAVVDQHLQARISALHMLAVSPLADDPSRWNDLYREALGFHASFGSHVIFADPRNMSMLFNTRAPFGSALPALPRPKGRAAAPTALKTGKPAVGDIFMGPVAKEPLVAIAVPAERQGKTVYLLLTTFETRQFQDRINQVSLPANWSMALLDSNREVIAIRTAPGMKTVNDIESSRHLTAKSAVSGWSVILGIPHGIYNEEAVKTAVALTAAVCLVILVSVLGGTLVSRRLAKAVASLTETSGQKTPPTDIFEIESVRRLLEESAAKRKEYEESLKLSEEKYKMVADFTYDWETWTDAEYKYRYTSPSCERITGYSSEDFIANPHLVIDITHPDDKEIVRKHFLDDIRDPNFCQFDFRIITRDGKERWISHSCTPIYDQNGKFIGRRGSNQDITDRKQAEKEKQALEERLQRAEKMEALGLLAGGVAHDLNNIIGIIVGYAEMMSDDMDESDPKKEDLRNIMEGGEKAAAVIEDLLTMARRGVTSRKIINLNTLITNFSKSAEWEKLHQYHSSVQFTTDLEADLPNISASPIHVEKTLFNLVSNACEAMANGGRLTIKTSNRYLDKPVHEYDSIYEGNYVVLSVSDTGEGITDSDMKRIFEPFYTRKVMGRSGTGLGLAVVWGTVKDHQGYIDVESETGKGTTFTLYFPVAKEDVSEKISSLPVSEYMGHGESILVVDDVKGQRDLAMAMLTKLGYTVTGAASGEDALDYLKKNHVDLIVLDMIMEPGMNGLNTYRKILEIHPGQKAIIVSGFSESEQVSEVQSLGAGAYVKKPYILERLGTAVRQELDRSA